MGIPIRRIGEVVGLGRRLRGRFRVRFPLRRSGLGFRLLQLVASLGLSCSESPRRSNRLRRGLFGGLQALFLLGGLG